MRAHNVIHQSELGPNFGKAFYDKQKADRERRLSGNDPKHRKELKSKVAETITKLEQGMTPAKPREGDLA